MKCKCQDEINAKLTEHYKAPSRLMGYRFTFSDTGGDTRSFTEVNTTTTTKTGKTKVVKSNMFHSYCPFCGIDAK